MDQFDHGKFESEVMAGVELIEAELALGDALFALPNSGANEVSGTETDAEKAIITAKDIVDRQDIRARLCPSLNSLADDSREIAKVVTAAMLPLAIVGTLPLSPLVFAAVAIVIARMGIKALCPN
jgi:hypothetical protein